MRTTYTAWWRLAPPLLLSLLCFGAASRDIPLIEAVKKADTSAVRALLKQRADVNIPQPDGTTALHFAAQRGDIETADLLIRAGANVRAANRYGVTPLSLACTSGHGAMVERLLLANADPNTALSEGETALMSASRAGSVAAVKALLARGANVNAAEDWRGQTALMWAAAEGHTDVVQMLLKAGADVNARSKGAPAPTRGGGPAGAAGGGRRSEAAATGGAAPTAAGERAGAETAGTPSAAVNINAAEAARANALSRAAGSRTAFTFTPMLFAVRAGQIGVVRALLDGGANANDAVSDGTSAMTLAIINAHFELAAVLLDRGADPNADAQGWTALHQLEWTRKPNFGRPPPPPVPTGNLGTLDLAKALLAHGANPNARQKREPKDNNRNDLNRIGATPFLLAARAADTEMMRLLVANGADPLLANQDGTTPLMVAAGVGLYKVGESPGTSEEALEAVKLAFELGGDVNAVDDYSDTAMHGAALRGANNIVEFLVEKGIKLEYIDQKDKRGWTPLEIADGIFHISVFVSQPDTAALLRRLKADAASKSARP